MQKDSTTLGGAGTLWVKYLKKSMFSRRIDSNPPESWNMSKIEMEELDTNEDGIMENYPIYVQSKAQRIPRPRDPQLVDPQPGCFGNGPGPMKVLIS